MAIPLVHDPNPHTPKTRLLAVPAHVVLFRHPPHEALPVAPRRPAVVARLRVVVVSLGGHAWHAAAAAAVVAVLAAVPPGAAVAG